LTVQDATLWTLNVRYFAGIPDLRLVSKNARGANAGAGSPGSRWSALIRPDRAPAWSILERTAHMRKVFVSYSRKSQDLAMILVEDIKDLGYDVWFDRDLTGGQAWWDRILTEIREREIFVSLVDENGLNSAACRLELRYAAAWGRRVLPVLGGEVSVNLLPQELSALQLVDFQQQDKKSAKALSKALHDMLPAGPLPHPLPSPPAAPVSPLGILAGTIDTALELSRTEQLTLVGELRLALKDPQSATDARKLLGKLRARPDLLVGVAMDIDELMGRAGGGAARCHPSASGPRRRDQGESEGWADVCLDTAGEIHYGMHRGR